MASVEGNSLLLQGQTGKYFFVVQSSTYALKLPAKKPDKPGEAASPEQTVCSSDILHLHVKFRSRAQAARQEARQA